MEELTAHAPGRVNLIGEHTDYNGGTCLPLAIGLGTTVRVRPRSDDRFVLVSHPHDAWPGGRWEGSTHDLEPGRVTSWPAYVLGVFWALGHTHGADVEITSTVPGGAGLSSSAALVCSVARALSPAPAEELVAPTIAAETQFVGAPTGGLDQTVSLLARAGHALELDFATGTRVHVPWTPESAGLHLVVIDTRTTHAHADGGYAARREECHRARTALGVDHLAAADPGAVAVLEDPVLKRRARHVVTEVARVAATGAALRAGDWGRVGELFTASHDSLRDDFEVSCPELDTAVVAAVDSGAVGARMTGGGFGGSAIALTPDPERTAALVERAFAARGWTAPRTHDAPAGAGASRGA